MTQAEIDAAIASLERLLGADAWEATDGALSLGVRDDDGFRPCHDGLDAIDALASIHAVALVCLRDYSSLVEALKAVVKTDDDCPVCDRGRLRNPAKTHWPECPFGRAQVLLAKLEPQP